MALKVLGAGFGRTGTLSLKYALEELGFGPCHHMMEVMRDLSKMNGFIEYLKEIESNGEKFLPIIRRP